MKISERGMPDLGRFSTTRGHVCTHAHARQCLSVYLGGRSQPIHLAADVNNRNRTTPNGPNAEP